jgi:tetratricopeptide (TPR) repeat protein
MNKLILELRERGVLRAAGLYIAFTWLILQIGDVVLPVFELPDSVLKYVLFGSIGGFPVAMLISWFYDISASGIRSEEEIREAGDKRSKGLLSTATITLLLLALGVSLYANFQQASDVDPTAIPASASILISDFVNQTGDPQFDGSVESALAVGIEGAPFISTFGRNEAQKIAMAGSGDDNLTEQAARLISENEGIQLILLGAIEADGEGYSFSLRVIDPRVDEVVAEAESTAANKLDVLPAVGRLAIQVREELGDTSLDDKEASDLETFTAASLEAAYYYTIAQGYAHREQDQQAIEYYQKAVAEDPGFGRAYSGWALSTAKLGQTELAQELWAKTLNLLDSMTERERYRTLGVYYQLGNQDLDKAIENLSLLVHRFPADNIGRNNLALAYFSSRQFDEAIAQGAELLALQPGNTAFRSNYALYAMYAGDFPLAIAEAEALLAEAPDYFPGYIPLAIAALAQGDTATALAHYHRMATINDRAASLAISGEADIALLGGDYEKAASLLRQGRIRDLEAGNIPGAAHKGVYLALSEYRLGNTEKAQALLDEVLPTTTAISHLLPAALLLAEMGLVEDVEAIQRQLKSRPQPSSRAAADGLSGVLALRAGNPGAAVDAFNASLDRVDSWQGRFLLGHAYADAGYFAEALGEFEKCEDRLGETSAIYLDDVPTYHYSAALLYWLGYTKQQLGMRREALENYQRYLVRRTPQDQSALTLSARAQVAILTP